MKNLTLLIFAIISFSNANAQFGPFNDMSDGIIYGDPVDFVPLDFDLDGDLDVMIRGMNYIYWTENLGVGVFTEPVSLAIAEGTYDFSVADSLKSESILKMGLKNRYYSITKNNWRFIILDGNDLSFHGAISEIKKQQTDSLFQLLTPKKLLNLQKWNGGLSLSQLNWVKNELETAKANNENVGFYCHFPAVKDGEVHNLWNYKQFIDLIDNYKNVKFYFNGHNHNGDYVLKNGVHHLTFKGMVDTENTSAFATATISKDSIIIDGYGREPSRRLKIK